MVATVPAKRGRKPAATTAAPQGGQVQSLTRGLKLLEWIAESHSSVALTELAQQAGTALSTIDQHTASAVGVVQNIAGGTQEQRSASQNITRTIEQISQMAEDTHQIVSSNASDVDQLKQVAGQLREGLQQFRR